DKWVGDKNILNFLANYYNQAISLKKEVVVAVKEGQMNHDSAVLDYERGGPGNVTPFYWLSDDTVSPSSWCYVEGMKYYTVTQEIHSLIDKVSKNGNLLLNISPKPDGTIPQAQKDILLGMGDWLKKFGESIYSTRAWTVYGEGPTHMGGGAFTAPVRGTKQDIRFTRNVANNTLYAIVLDWPGDGAQLNLQTLKSSRIDLSSLKKVELLGEQAGKYIALDTHAQDKTGLKITMPPQSPYSASAYAIKLTFSGTIPTLTPDGYAKASAEKTGEGAEQAFDSNPKTKWYTKVNGAT
ncbi:TPA: alpha-L-fucosidase, partial [Candidatus Sumerlaeota bacterium]|nr:alpha-L-fucosidase [Candidatus Sumerlaeota bacterium]